ncbi:uncharacterized protein LOC120154081 [Hibiscus syriacus]|uniref:uncharacterized protein LOC120154081 n=1 Tax=Hibiscus syriacus TaxID=106335 RepID=UPI001921F107|nr:uncharacterized protein LOC120154081 [Hibiscus syriacus]
MPEFPLQEIERVFTWLKQSLSLFRFTFAKNRQSFPTDSTLTRLPLKPAILYPNRLHLQSSAHRNPAPITSKHARFAKPNSTLCSITLGLTVSTLPILEGKQRGSSRACMQGAPWILPTPAKFFNTGIVVALKIHLILDALLLRMPLTMTNAVCHLSLPISGWFLYTPC